MGKIVLRLDRMMVERKMALNELAERVGISNVNLSKIKNNKVTAIRFAALADAISVLPEQTREEILRYYFLRQPQRVIGACIGRSRSTAGRHIQLALQRLREEMGVSRYE